MVPTWFRNALMSQGQDLEKKRHSSTCAIHPYLFLSATRVVRTNYHKNGIPEMSNLGGPSLRTPLYSEVRNRGTSQFGTQKSDRSAKASFSCQKNSGSMVVELGAHLPNPVLNTSDFENMPASCQQPPSQQPV